MEQFLIRVTDMEGNAIACTFSNSDGTMLKTERLFIKYLDENFKLDAQTEYVPFSFNNDPQVCIL